jgi:hypothetical protein
MVTLVADNYTGSFGGSISTVVFNVPKRAVATITIYAPYSGTAGAVSLRTASVDDTNYGGLYLGDKTFKLSWGTIPKNTSSNSFITYQWTADAEL